MDAASKRKGDFHERRDRHVRRTRVKRQDVCFVLYAYINMHI